VRCARRFQGFGIVRRQLVEETPASLFPAAASVAPGCPRPVRGRDQRAQEGLGTEFHFLRDVALNQCDADRLAKRRRPAHLRRPGLPRRPMPGKRGRRASVQQRTRQGNQQGQAMHAEQRCKSGQRAGWCLRVADSASHGKPVKIQLLSQSTAAIRAAKISACCHRVAGCQRLKAQPAQASETAPSPHRTGKRRSRPATMACRRRPRG
jgi:hypothetical protein